MMSWLARQDGYDPNAFDVPGEQTYDRRFDRTWPGQLAQDVTGAVLAPGRALQSTEPITTEQMIKPAMDMAGLVTGGSYAAPAQRGASGAGIRAYHSSPHDFDKFDLAKIGSGEGAQAYGHGLYFAESPAVSGQGGQYWQQFLPRMSADEQQAARRLAAENFDRKAAIETTQQILDRAKYPERFADQQRMLELLKGGKPVGPRTYEVNINADPAHMLDWDKPIAAHPERVREALANTLEEAPFRRLPRDRVLENALEGIPGHATGETLYRHLAERGSSQVAPLVTERMLMNNIPGIKYLDQGSRNMVRPTVARNTAMGDIPILEPDPIPKKTHNYVIFDPNLIDITKKYAVPGAIGAGGMGALAAQNQYEEVY